MRNACLAAMAVILIGFAGLPARVLATEQSDIVNSLNVLPLMINKITGDTIMAIIYDPADPASLADAQAIMAMLGSGDSTTLKIPGGGKLTGMLVRVGELGKLARARMAFLTPGLSRYLSDISMAASAAGILTFSTDVECVRQDKCIIAVVTKPNLTIYFSRAAADNAKIEFSQAFALLVKQP